VEYMRKLFVVSIGIICLATTTAALAEDCSMIGGCEDIVGYIALKNEDGKPTYTEKKIPELGDTITLDTYLFLRTWPGINQGSGLRHKTKVKILEFYHGEKELAVVRIISVPSVEVKPYPWEQKQ
jgi:hypothetical protein